jgi:hypothetical protein
MTQCCATSSNAGQQLRVLLPLLPVAAWQATHPRIDLPPCRAQSVSQLGHPLSAGTAMVPAPTQLMVAALQPYDIVFCIFHDLAHIGDLVADVIYDYVAAQPQPGPLIAVVQNNHFPLRFHHMLTTACSVTAHYALCIMWLCVICLHVVCACCVAVCHVLCTMCGCRAAERPLRVHGKPDQGCHRKGCHAALLLQVLPATPTPLLCSNSSLPLATPVPRPRPSACHRDPLVSRQAMTAIPFGSKGHSFSIVTGSEGKSQRGEDDRIQEGGGSHDSHGEPKRPAQERATTDAVPMVSRARLCTTPVVEASFVMTMANRTRPRQSHSFALAPPLLLPLALASSLCAFPSCLRQLPLQVPPPLCALPSPSSLQQREGSHKVVHSKNRQKGLKAADQ